MLEVGVQWLVKKFPFHNSWEYLLAVGVGIYQSIFLKLLKQERLRGFLVMQPFSKAFFSVSMRTDGLLIRDLLSNWESNRQQLSRCGSNAGPTTE